MPFNSVGWVGLIDQVLKHREGINSGTERHGILLDLEEGWQERLEDAVCQEYGDLCQDPQHPEPYRTPLERTGRRLWGILHDYASQYPVSPSLEQQEAAKGWLSKWERDIPNFQCSCRREWDQIVRDNPPDFSGRVWLWDWTIKVHNLVNARLPGKVQWSGEIPPEA